MKKSDVETHRVGYGGSELPAVNVKVYRVGASTINVMERFDCDEQDAEKALELAFNAHCESFWDGAQDIADDSFDVKTKVYSEGRSGGWLVVDGLDDVESWNAITLAKWARFCKRVRAEVDFQCSSAQILGTIEANEYYKHGSEAFNLVERADGTSACIADLKRDARAAGFGPVVRGDK